MLRSAALVCVVLAAGCAAPRSAPMLTPPPPTPPVFDLQGHRGARGLLPENTIPAFLRALDLGVETLELDVVVSADGIVVVSHEPWMNAEICAHPDGRPVAPAEAEALNLYRMPYAEIARYDCGRRRHPRFPEQAPTPAVKPRLADVIAAADAHARAAGRPLPRYNVETKARPAWDGIYTPDPDAFAAAVVDVIWTAGAFERASIQSFDARTLRATYRIARAMPLVLLVEAGAPEATFAENLAGLGVKPHTYSPAFALVTPALVAEAHAAGVRIVPWTVNERADMQRLVAMGVDGLITDYPDRFERVWLVPRVPSPGQ